MLGGAGLADGDDHQLGDALGEPHEAGRVDGFVGRDDDDPLGSGCYGRLADRQRAQDVGDKALVGIGLDQRHVLVGGGVEDDLRALAQEELAHAARVGDVGHRRADRDGAAQRGQVALELVQAGLVHVDGQHRRRSDAEHLARELGADRAGARR